ncbi:MAG TPA: hypothetical protein VK934_06235 [Fimbriimonas sp.]|nr:hypothetical protein [Fimbriimonas sp.]
MLLTLLLAQTTVTWLAHFDEPTLHYVDDTSFALADGRHVEIRGVDGAVKKTYNLKEGETAVGFLDANRVITSSGERTFRISKRETDKTDFDAWATTGWHYYYEHGSYLQVHSPFLLIESEYGQDICRPVNLQDQFCISPSGKKLIVIDNYAEGATLTVRDLTKPGVPRVERPKKLWSHKGRRLIMLLPQSCSLVAYSDSQLIGFCYIVAFPEGTNFPPEEIAKVPTALPPGVVANHFVEGLCTINVRTGDARLLARLDPNAGRSEYEGPMFDSDNVRRRDLVALPRAHRVFMLWNGSLYVVRLPEQG